MFEEQIGLLVDREAVEREGRRLVTRLKFANLRQTATIEGGSQHEGGARSRQGPICQLATGDWIGGRHDLLITAKVEPAS
jgi:hypothetical protein